MFTARRIAPGRLLLLLALCLVATVACVAQPDEGRGTSALISDQNHGGQVDFVFLPPVTPPPASVGDFLPDLAPTVIAETESSVTVAAESKVTGWSASALRVTTGAGATGPTGASDAGGVQVPVAEGPGSEEACAEGCDVDASGTGIVVQPVNRAVKTIPVASTRETPRRTSTCVVTRFPSFRRLPFPLGLGDRSLAPTPGPSLGSPLRGTRERHP